MIIIKNNYFMFRFVSWDAQELLATETVLNVSNDDDPSQIRETTPMTIKVRKTEFKFIILNINFWFANIRIVVSCYTSKSENKTK